MVKVHAWWSRCDNCCIVTRYSSVSGRISEPVRFQKALNVTNCRAWNEVNVNSSNDFISLQRNQLTLSFCRKYARRYRFTRSLTRMQVGLRLQSRGLLMSLPDHIQLWSHLSLTESSNMTSVRVERWSLRNWTKLRTLPETSAIGNKLLNSNTSYDSSRWPHTEIDGLQ